MGGPTTKVINGVYCRPPSINEEVETSFLAQMDRAARAGRVIIMGDFNYPGIDWSTVMALLGQLKGKSIAGQFYGAVY